MAVPPLFGRLPDAQQQRQANQRYDPSGDVDQPGTVEIGDGELHDRKRPARDQDRGPDADDATPARHRPDQPHRHDQRKERQLPSHHRAEQERIDAGDAGKTRDRRAERAIGDGRRIGNQRKPRGRERREAESDQDRAGDCNGSAEARRALEEGAEGEGDE